MKRFKRPIEITFLLITILCMNYFYPQYFESEFPLFIDLFTTPIFSLFVVLNIFSTTITLKFVRNNAVRIALVFLYSIVIALLFREVVKGSENIIQIKLLFVVLQISILAMGLTSKMTKSLGGNWMGYIEDLRKDIGNKPIIMAGSNATFRNERREILLILFVILYVKQRNNCLA